MFDLQNEQFKLASVNLRAELHGEDRVPACDLVFEGTVSNEVLKHFHPELRQMLFKRDETPDLVDQAQPDALTALRFPKLGTLRYDWEGTGYKLTIDYGISGKSDIDLSDCTVDKFRIDPMQGGSVRVLFRVICHPDGEQVGKLSELIQQEVEISVTPPEPTTVEELFGEDKKAA